MFERLMRWFDSQSWKLKTVVLLMLLFGSVIAIGITFSGLAALHGAMQ